MPKRDQSGLLVPFATCGDGEIRHVMQIERTARGPFTCLGCGERLSLRRPTGRRSHFAHRPDSRCSGETALHLYAKILLMKSRRMTLPSLVISEGRLRELVFQGGEVTLDRVMLEVAAAGFQPEAVVEVGPERRAVEFKVSHAVDLTKKARVEAAGCPMIEVDLSSIRWRRLDQRELDDQIVDRRGKGTPVAG